MFLKMYPLREMKIFLSIKRREWVKRMILLNFFRAEAERKRKIIMKKSNIIYAIEEPETSQHQHDQDY